MLSMMISSPRQPKDDIDIYLSPLTNDLRLLWKEAIEVFVWTLKTTTNQRVITMDMYCVHFISTYSIVLLSHSNVLQKMSMLIMLCDQETFETKLHINDIKVQLIPQALTLTLSLTMTMKIQLAILNRTIIIFFI